MYVQCKPRSTTRQGSCKVPFEGRSVTIKGWFLTELKRQRKETKDGGRSETKTEQREICRKTPDLVRAIMQLCQNPPLPYLLSFCRVVVISFPAVLKDPGTFQLSLIWQMSNNFAFNFCPAGAKYVRQQIDATVVRKMVDCWWLWNWILTHPNSPSSLECHNGISLSLLFSSQVWFFLLVVKNVHALENVLPVQ